MNLRDELIRYYRLLRQYGLNDSHSGNASVRDGDTVWITPSGACADTLTADDLVACNSDGTIGAGASLDSALHLAVYKKNKNARAVLHSHCPHVVALTLNGEAFTPVDFEGGYYFDNIPVVDLPYADYIDKSPEAISRLLVENKAAVYRGHGVYTQGESLNLAYKWTCSLELSAKTAWLAKLAGTHSANKT
ncbi:MAG: class II aldolase/adducin family protein [Gammaproteobacteria bacterium]|nr:class II aldolase/adducin family protein [Gammaproteobacteria bacterium]